MTLAHGLTGDMDYIFAYMDENIDPALCKYPEESFLELFGQYRDIWKKELRFLPEQLGVSKFSTIPTLVKGMYKYYTKEQEKSIMLLHLF